ncbi:hypothetical protein GCM10027516_03790 [Niabella aquatica]
MFMNAGLNKFLHYMPDQPLDAEMARLVGAMMTIKWLMPLVGFIEVTGGLLFIFPKTRALGALVILPVMIGIMLHNATFMPSGLAIAVPLFMINLWMIADNWNKYKPLVR